MNTKELNIKILEVAGYTVNLYEKTFSIWKGGVKLLGASLRCLDNAPFAADFIQRAGYKEGYQKGKTDLKRDLKQLLEV